MTSFIPRILIVDDNAEIHGDFKKILQNGSKPTELDALEAEVFGNKPLESDLDCALDFASQGIQALEMVKRARAEARPYAMAFVDVRMPPGWDGVRTISEIRKVEPNMEFVICTAYSDYTPEEASRKVGLSNGLLFVIKPFDAAIIRQLARNMAARVNDTTLHAG